jgi:F0F1-type ATP synthase epsilon subunit
VEKVEEAKQRAETLLREQKIDSQEYAALQVSLERELVRLKVGRKYRKLKGIHTTGKANQ